MTPFIWLYTIHGRNANIIHLLEENHINPRHMFDNKKNCKSYHHSYQPCLEESIKCHHNEIAEYVLNNKITEMNIIKNINDDYYRNNITFCFQYRNFSDLFDNIDDNEFIFYCACQFNYIKIVKLFIYYAKLEYVNKKKEFISILFIIRQ